MDKNHLLATAKQLQQVSNLSIEEYTKKQQQLIAEMNKLMLARTDLKTLIGKDNMSMMQDNHANHVRFIAAILKNHSADVLVETILWVFRAYKNHGFSSNYWAAQLNTWIQVLKNVLTIKTYNEVIPLYEWMQINIPIFDKVSNQKTELPNSLH